MRPPARNRPPSLPRREHQRHLHSASLTLQPPQAHHEGSSSRLTVLFAGGGTGGHIFPAIATAEELLRLNPACTPRFLCSTRPLDAEILGKARIDGHPADFVAIPAQPFGLRPRAAFRFISSWGGAVRAGREVIRAVRARGPVVVAAFGGFVAAPIVQAARVERVPILMVNLDAIPGKANRWIARHARRVLTTTPPRGVGSTNWKQIRPIVRRASVTDRTAAECRAAFGLDASTPTLLITGGSQGAGSINAFLRAFAREHAPLLAPWQILHQTGKEGADEMRAAYADAGIRASVMPFITDMGQAWGAADAAVGRAGAGTVAEAWANRVPTLFMPYPYHKDQHQKFNAMPLVEARAALIATDHIDAQANMREAGPMLAALIGGPVTGHATGQAPNATPEQSQRERLAANLKILGPADGAATVAAQILELAK